MEWYYVDNGETVGPLTDEVFRGLVTEGRITATTLVWSQGMDEWQPYGQLAQPPPSPGEMPPPVAEPQQVCAMCGQSFPQDAVIQIQGQWICAGCKPAFLQGRREGVTAAGGVWRDGKTLVARIGADLPPRCVKCNAEAAEKPLRKTFYWHHPAIFLLLFFNLLIYAVVAMVTRKTARFQVPLCTEHRAVRTRNVLIVWGLVVLGILLVIIGAAAESGPPAIIGGALLLAAIVFGVSVAAVLKPKKITAEHAFLRGAGPAFLDNLPQWQG